MVLVEEEHTLGERRSAIIIDFYRIRRNFEEICGHYGAMVRGEMSEGSKFRQNLGVGFVIWVVEI